MDNWPHSRYTNTSAGRVEHARMRVGDQDILAPVKVDPSLTNKNATSEKRLPPPVMMDGRYVYMLPGGEEIVL